jgi:acyl-CoA synthetase (AMP-forming)/AMP-acid ligase II
MQYRFTHVQGSNLDQSINVSTSRHLKNMTEKHPSSILINSYDQDQQLTYQQVLEKAEQLATGLIKTFNLNPKDRIGLYAYNKS